MQTQEFGPIDRLGACVIELTKHSIGVAGQREGVAPRRVFGDADRALATREQFELSLAPAGQARGLDRVGPGEKIGEGDALGVLGPLAQAGPERRLPGLGRVAQRRRSGADRVGQLVAKIEEISFCEDAVDVGVEYSEKMPQLLIAILSRHDWL